MLLPFIPGAISIDDISPAFSQDIQVAVLRSDKLHPVISGNKWFKLKFYLEEAKAKDKKNIITFGGAWSNHIVATAAACRLSGLNATGIIRGEEPSAPSSTLLQAKEWGMRLIFVSRTLYKEPWIPPESITGNDYIIPEGGYGENGAKGAATLLDHCSKNFTHYCCAAGTGTMMAGLINAVPGGQQVIGISVLKNNRDLEKQVAALTRPGKEHNWQLIHDYHFGGYAKYGTGLFEFMNDFYRTTGIPSDFVYTGKLFYAVADLAEKNFFPPGSRVLLIHSGGLQGNTSVPKGTLIF